MLPGTATRSAPTSLTPSAGSPDEFSLPLDLGEVVALQVLARGGMGVTFLGCLKSNSQQIVIKIPLNADANLLERFRNETRLLEGLRHDQIVRFVAAGETEIVLANETHMLPWLAMEFIPGQSLRLKLKQGGRMTWVEVFRMLEDVLSALAYLSSVNLCHRDIKPDNLIHDPQTDSWKVVDFGIAKALVENLLLTLTLAESAAGAWDYMSPEQLSGQPVDIRSDIYSLGKTAWEALIGDVPRVGTPYPSALLGPDNVPPDVDLLIRRMVEHRPDLRYQTPSESLAALREGAGAIVTKEKKRKVVGNLIQILKVAATTFVIGGGVWIFADEHETQKVKEIVSSVSAANPTRASLLCRKLDGFRNAHRFWGRRYADAQYAKLEQTANDERQGMAESHQEIIRELAESVRDDNYKVERCRSFRSLYSEAFADTAEFKSLSAKMEIYETRVVSAKAVLLAKEGEITQALQLCDDLIRKLTVTEAMSTVSDTRDHIARVFAERELIELKPLAASKKEEDLLSVQTKLVCLEKIIGATPETQAVLKIVDDSLYISATDIVNTHCDRKEYNYARVALDRYLELSEFKAHKADAINAKQQVTVFEDDNDWGVIAVSAEKNISQNAFPLATQDYNNYLVKWSGGRHSTEANEGLKKIVGQHLDWLSRIPDFDEYILEHKLFTSQYVKEIEFVRTANRILARRSWIEIDRLFYGVADNKMQPLTALKRINEFAWQSCAQHHKLYLDNLADQFRAHLNRTINNTSTWDSELSFMYILQRPPSDCVKNVEAPTVYIITIKHISVFLSPVMLARLKGANNANPQIVINRCVRDSNKIWQVQQPIFNELGPINTNYISMHVGKRIYTYAKFNVIDTVLYDADPIGGGKLTGLNWLDLDISTSGTKTWRDEDGTVFSIQYDSE